MRSKIIQGRLLIEDLRYLFTFFDSIVSETDLLSIPCFNFRQPNLSYNYPDNGFTAVAARRRELERKDSEKDFDAMLEVRGVASMGSMGSAEPINFQRKVLEPIIF